MRRNGMVIRTEQNRSQFQGRERDRERERTGSSPHTGSGEGISFDLISRPERESVTPQSPALLRFPFPSPSPPSPNTSSRLRATVQCSSSFHTSTSTSTLTAILYVVSTHHSIQSPPIHTTPNNSTLLYSAASNTIAQSWIERNYSNTCFAKFTVRYCIPLQAERVRERERERVKNKEDSAIQTAIIIEMK